MPKKESCHMTRSEEIGCPPCKREYYAKIAKKSGPCHPPLLLGWC